MNLLAAWALTSSTGPLWAATFSTGVSGGFPPPHATKSSPKLPRKIPVFFVMVFSKLSSVLRSHFEGFAAAGRGGAGAGPTTGGAS